MSASPSTTRQTQARARALRGRLELLVRESSQTAHNEGAATGLPFWRIEPSPLIIPAADWATIEAACRQRTRLINAFLVDAYRSQEVLKNRILPPDVIFSDPYYRRPCLNLEPERENPATLLRFDLVRTTEGWMFQGTRTNTPIGLGFTVQNRRFLTEEAPEIYSAQPDYHSVIQFPLQLLDHLHSLSPKPAGDTSIVVLTAGPRDAFYSEHSFLARKMGLPLAQGDDLLVLDNRVYFKTIAGLEPVDVIYRRLNDAHIDPVVFSTDRETAGIPGLLQCVRHGNVVVANGIGCGLAETRAIDAYNSRLLRFYLGEKALLPTVPTYTCGDTDQLDYILDAGDALRLRPAHDARQGTFSLTRIRDEKGLAPEIAQNPFAFVAQKRVELVPVDSGSAHLPGCTLSVFALVKGKEITILPGGMTQLGTGDVPRDRVGVCTDTIVLQDSPRENAAPDVEEVPTPPPARVLGSRAAECLLWLGRYLERAEATARMLQIFDDVALEEIPARERARWLPVWRGLFEATGHDPLPEAARPLSIVLPLDQLWRMTLDGNHPSSIFSSVTSATENARQLRDYVSPEAWAVLNRLHSRLGVLRRPESGSLLDPRGNSAQELRRKNAEAATQSVTNEINAFLGTAERTMLHDAGWHFLRIGCLLERAIMTCSALRHVLVALSEEQGQLSAPQRRRDNAELSALLRMLGSQDAYRRLYQTRTHPHFVAALFLQQPDAPRSIFHNLHQIKHALFSIQADLPERTTPATDAVKDLLRFLSTLRLDRHFVTADHDLWAGHEELETLLQTLLDRLYALHPMLSDHFFSHQARLPAAQSELGL